MAERVQADDLSVEATKLDILAFEDAVEETEPLSESIKEHRKKLDTVRELGNDMFDALFKYEPKLKDADCINNQFRHNRNIMERAMATKEYESLRSFTKTQEFESALATSTIMNKIMETLDDEELERIQSESKVAGSLQRDVNSLQDYIDGLKEIIDVSDNDDVIGNAVEKMGKAEGDLKAAQGALASLILPAFLAVVLPLLIGFIMGPEALGAFLGGAIFTGIIFALLMANAGGLWDNAKKYIESGFFGGKGSEAHKAGVVGDTVGDPFKDTAGPSLNTLITVMSLVSSLFAPVIAVFHLF